MKLLFFGTPDFSVPTLNALYESSHDVLGVVTSPDKKSGRGLKIQSSSVKKRAENIGIPIFQPKELNGDEFISTIKQINPSPMPILLSGKQAKELPPIHMGIFQSISRGGSILLKHL